MAAGDRARRFRPAVGRGEAGSILLVSLLVLLVLTGVALIVVQNVTMELANVGAFRVAKQGYYLTEAGLTGPLAAYSSDPVAFMKELPREKDSDPLTDTAYMVFPSNINDDFYDFDTWGSFGPQFADSEAVAFVTYFELFGMSRPLPGYSDARCVQYKVISDGYLGKAAVKDIVGAEYVAHTALARFVSHVCLYQDSN